MSYTIIDDSTDCEDQGFTKLSDGCRLHPTFRRGDDKPRYTKLVKRGGFWTCPVCDGNYGPIERSKRHAR